MVPLHNRVQVQTVSIKFLTLPSHMSSARIQVLTEILQNKVVIELPLRPRETYCITLSDILGPLISSFPRQALYNENFTVTLTLAEHWNKAVTAHSPSRWPFPQPHAWSNCSSGWSAPPHRCETASTRGRFIMHNILITVVVNVQTLVLLSPRAIQKSKLPIMPRP